LRENNILQNPNNSTRLGNPSRIIKEDIRHGTCL
jgi:hypothetical protein